MSFPRDDYTPHGYLDNPAHTWRVGQSGVIRSVDAIGFGWHFPSYPGPYGRSWVYTTALRVGLRLGDELLLTGDDLRAAGFTLRAPYHSKNVFTFELLKPSLPNTSFTATFTFHLASPDALLVRAEILDSPSPFELFIGAQFHRNLGSSGVWDFGLFTKTVATGADAHIHLGCFAEGPHFTLQSDAAADRCGVWTGPPRGPLNELLRSEALTASRWETNPAEVGGALLFTVKRADVRWIALARGGNAEAARTAGTRAIARAESTLAERRADDAAFWSSAPRLEGDWPDHWRRGVVYDFETLRTIVRPPAGRLRHRWDGMQIQVPRVVLAETALDTLALSYAQPDLAKEVLLGTFADALAPNVPCCREDGTVNMVAADGAACGTAPSWGFPFFAIESIARRTHDRAWLAEIYPHLASFLEWWLANRTDEAGWAVFHCGWESGQDESPRFGQVPHGGVSIRHLRPVELQAAIAHAAGVMARFAGVLERPDDTARWIAIADDFTRRTHRLFHGDWFCDEDRRTGRSGEARDPMQLAPALLGVATPEQAAALRPAMRALPAHGEWTALEWPPVAFTILESAWALGERALAADLTAELLDRIYHTMDARQPGPNGPLPGIACEHWPPEGDWGTEGYGWGALGCVFLLRHLVGWRETEDGLALTPNLPPPLCQSGRRYHVRCLHVGAVRLDVTYAVIEPNTFAVEVAYIAPRPVRVVARPGRGHDVVVQHAQCGTIAAQIARGEGIRLSIEG